MSFPAPFPGPVPLYANVPINPQFYKPRFYTISNISLGKTTLVTTSTDHNYVVGQQIRLIIPKDFGSIQLNEVQGYVLSIPNTNQVVVDIDSSFSNAFIATPYTATITNATTSGGLYTLTANNSFTPGFYVIISNVGGITNGNGTFLIRRSTLTAFNIVNTGQSGAYTGGGVATLNVPMSFTPQILAIGDINSGATNNLGILQLNTSIPGSFINISPL